MAELLTKFPPVVSAPKATEPAKTEAAVQGAAADQPPGENRVGRLDELGGTIGALEKLGTRRSHRE